MSYKILEDLRYYAPILVAACRGLVGPFVPFGGLAGLPCLPPLYNDNLNLNLTFSFRLCNLGTLKRSHTGRGGGGSGEDGGRVGGEVHHHHKPAPREKALGLGDISSDSSGSGVGDKRSESEEESPRHRGGQVMS